MTKLHIALLFTAGNDTDDFQPALSELTGFIQLLAAAKLALEFNKGGRLFHKSRNDERAIRAPYGLWVANSLQASKLKVPTNRVW